MRNGNGASGPESGPIILGRGPSGRMVVLVSGLRKDD